MNKFRVLFMVLISSSMLAQQKRARDYGIEIGVLEPGKNNAITDVKGVKVGHTTLIEGDNIRTGVTAIIPHEDNIYQNKVPAAIYIGNGYGKLAGYSQVKELGNIETPVILTNTLSVAAATEALISYTLENPENKEVKSVNSVVGETNDGWLNDIRGRHVHQKHVLEALQNASPGIVQEGNVGAGTGTVCFEYKGGIGTASRVLPKSVGGFTLGVLVQTNFGGVLEINGVPIDKELDRLSKYSQYSADGSCMMVVITDAPLDSRNLERIAKRAMLGLAKTGGIASNGSGDFVIAMSTAKENLVPNKSESSFNALKVLRNEEVTPLFQATIEATEEAIINSLFTAETMTGHEGHTVPSIPTNTIIDAMKKFNKLKK
ncbi:DmpA family aminopeptidase [Aquimarina mytili]|uniref:P1 family peptidase n=1 Tax=Aquimarina mytili TaxID=874423 RepID=A0A937DA21_9FLAO|nr:P1 family peptidase [Aquimarina mytili]MBL0683113.1 P1 family peptidase [Aquimarina mytili]